MSAISTHVLDLAAGCPAAGIQVRLERAVPAANETAAEEIATARTDANGRVASLGPDVIAPGTYQLIFDTGSYLTRQGGRETGTAPFFPEVTITFSVADQAGQHYHVPLLLSPFGYSTYRGS
jgi:5-hydroxyisourate hydrolase